MADAKNASGRIPVFALARHEGECFDCFAARLLLDAYQYYTDELGQSHKRAADSLGVERASLYQRLRRARERPLTCECRRLQQLPATKKRAPTTRRQRTTTSQKKTGTH